MHDWHLIIAGYTAQFKRGAVLWQQVSIKTGTPHRHQLLHTLAGGTRQGGELAVTAETTLIHFDYRTCQSIP